MSDPAEHSRANDAQPLTRSQKFMSLTRLYSGLIIFAYCLFHFANHAVGVLLVDSMESARLWIMWIWHLDLLRWPLYAALLVHPTVSLASIYQRRHLRLPPAELIQLLSGILIPVLIMQHVASALLAEQMLAVKSTYHRILLEHWVDQPWRALQMALLLVVVWAHACLGIHYWLRYRQWYIDHIHYFIAGAVALPALALAGYVASGITLARDVAVDSEIARLIRENAKSSGPVFPEFAAYWESALLVSYTLIVATLFATRWLRALRARQINPIKVRFLDGAEVLAPQGLSLLEVSRLAGIPHQSKCGGRGRCSTCRVRILANSDPLPPPDALEEDTLSRINAAPDVRLACQLRPSGALAIQTLMPPESQYRQRPELAGLHFGQEMNVVIMVIDLRDSTQLCAQKLPYDSLFIVEQYLNIVVAGVRGNDGHIVSVAGDGVTALFGLNSELPKACRDALSAAESIWRGMDTLNEELAAELPWPLKFGVGVHAGESVVGITTTDARTSVQFLGNTGNIASRLESASKKFNCTVVISEYAASISNLDRSFGEHVGVDLDGWPEPMSVVAISNLQSLQNALTGTSELSTSK